MSNILKQEWVFETPISKRRKWRWTYICSNCGKTDSKIYKISTWHDLCKHCSKGGFSTQEFINKCNEIHKYRYTYLNTQYINKRSPVTITCLQHGDFVRKAGDHLEGSNCPQCSLIFKGTKSSTRIYNKLQDNDYQPIINPRFTNKIAKLYLLYLPTVDMYKLGYCTTSLKKRMQQTDFILIKQWELPYKNAVNTEHMLHKQLQEFAYVGTKKLIRTGNTELYKINILDLVTELITKHGDLTE